MTRDGRRQVGTGRIGVGSVTVVTRSHTNEQYITFLSSRGMAVNEVKFLLSLIDLRNQQNTSTIDGTTY